MKFSCTQKSWIQLWPVFFFLPFGYYKNLFLKWNASLDNIRASKRGEQNKLPPSMSSCLIKPSLWAFAIAGGLAGCNDSQRSETPLKNCHFILSSCHTLKPHILLENESELQSCVPETVALRLSELLLPDGLWVRKTFASTESNSCRKSRVMYSGWDKENFTKICAERENHIILFGNPLLHLKVKYLVYSSFRKVLHLKNYRRKQAKKKIQIIIQVRTSIWIINLTGGEAGVTHFCSVFPVSAAFCSV